MAATATRPDCDSDAETVRVFVGCDPNDCDLEQMMVLEYSLRRHATVPVELHWMRLSRDPASPWYSDDSIGAGWRTERWATPFSGFRWAVPALCGFAGRAIYMDTDVVALCDIAELWRSAIESPAVVLARHEGRSVRFCVSLWDCARAESRLPALEALRADPRAHEASSSHFASRPWQVDAIDPSFNCIDGEGLPIDRIRMLHYSDMGTQFSHPRAALRLAAEGSPHWFDGEVRPHPRLDLAALFERYFHDALASGRHLDDYRNPSPFGPVRKRSERHYKGNRTTRPGLFSSWHAALRGGRR